MLFPSTDQYSKLIEEKAPGTWYALNEYTFRSIVPGQASPYIQGKSCIIFKAEKHGVQYAIRCFVNADPEIFKRYDEVCTYLSSRKLSWRTDCEYLRNELRFEGEQYPVVKMEWINGVPLNKFIDQAISDPARLSKLQQDLVALSQNLEQNGIGHGDLNFNHILVTGSVTDFTLRLVDYDAMFVPAFGGENSTVSGTPGFQHPGRLASDYSETIDRFSIWVLITGLEALKQDPQLWTQPERFGYRTNENMLFTFRELVSPDKSRLFQHLASYKNDALRFYVKQLENFCASPGLDVVTKPEIHKTIVRMPEDGKGGIPLPQKLFNVEIKTIPAGREVLVNGTKKGVTPLRLALAKEDFEHVEVLNAWEKTPLRINEQVHTYEIDFLKKNKEERFALPAEEAEIVDFSANHYSVPEGGIVSIRWKVKGNGKIHIDPIGDVTEKTGSREFVVNSTTQYELSIGSIKRSFSVHVQPKARQKYLRSKMQTKPEGSSDKESIKKIMRWVLVICSIIVLAIAAYYLIPEVAGKKSATADSQLSFPAANTPAPMFTVNAVQAFLNGLYDSYNKRDLKEITDHYAEPVGEYYDSKNISRDSLAVIIKNLFISPAYYSCTPDFSSLKVHPDGNACSVGVEITELLQKNPSDKRETFHTKIAYVIDENYRIVSEKSDE
jgi:hypothetical protein